ncbi:MAG: glutamate-cysteine ligase family protein [Micavibrio sp.]|nr:glutamate-cysteine ligase family protein [Micavibrio sp.]
MSRVYRSANPNHIFKDRSEIEEHLLAKVGGNAGGKIGTELELFVTSPEGRPITFDQVEMVLEHFAGQFPQAKAAFEKGRIVALNIPGVGDVSLEPGGQVELSTKPCANMAELEQTNRAMRAALENTAAFLDLRVKGQGHMPSFLDADDMPRSRFAAYCGYLRGQHGEKADHLIDTMKSCCGLQVNVDPMGNDFHEIYRALMLVDVAHSLSQRTERQGRLHETYAKLVPDQMVPVFEALEANSNETLIAHAVDRLLKLKIPFMPDAAAAEGFKSTASVFGATPSVGELLARGALTTEILDNALTLQLTMPNLRRHGVVETRAPDSPDTVEDLMKTAKIYHDRAYDAQSRRQLLQDFSGIDPAALKAAFLARFDEPREALFARDLGNGKTVADLVQTIEGAKPAPVAKPRPAMALRSQMKQRNG